MNTTTAREALDLLFGENAIPMSDRNAHLYDLIDAALAEHPSAPPSPTAVEDLLHSAERVSWKFGHNEAGEPSDWSEWSNLREAIAAVRSASPVAAGWQPIETAPKDDRAYLVYDPDPGHITIARWWLNGWRVGDLPGEDAWPTHWMPIPQAPKE